MEVKGVIPHISLELGKDLLDLMDDSKELSKRFINKLDIFCGASCIKELGFWVSPIVIKANLELEKNMYVIKINDKELGHGRVYLDKFLVIGPESVLKKIIENLEIEEIIIEEPVYNLPAMWLEDKYNIYLVEKEGVMVFDSISVIGMHLYEIIRSNLNMTVEFLTPLVVRTLINKKFNFSSKIFYKLFPELRLFSLNELTEILRNLVREGIPIKNLDLILGYVAEGLRYTKNIDLLTDYVRSKLALYISDMLARNKVIYVAEVKPTLEDIIWENLKKNNFDITNFLDSEICKNLLVSVKEFVEYAKSKNYLSKDYLPVIMTCFLGLRIYFKRIIEKEFPNVYVISYSEVFRGYKVEKIWTIDVNRDFK